MATRFSVGQHVQLHPATDRAMVGDRFGRVVKIGRSLVQVEMFKSGHLIRVHPDKLLPMEPAARRVEIDLGRAGSIGKSRKARSEAADDRPRTNLTRGTTDEGLMAIVKASYTRRRGAAKANIRYITHRAGKDGEKMTRRLFGYDGDLIRRKPTIW